MLASGLHVASVSVAFGGIHALSDVSFEAPRSQITGLIGPNGAGKTTLFNVLCGFVRPQAGEMSWDGARLTPHPSRLASLGIARTLQGVGVFGSLSVFDNVKLGAERIKRGGLLADLVASPRNLRSERRLTQRAGEALEALDITRYANDRAGALPYPIQKRVSIARALAADPELLLMDEPAGGLGAEDIDELEELIGRLCQDRGTTILLVEHHMDFVMKTCSNLVVLDFGKVIARGGPDEVKRDPAVADAYLGVAVDHESAGPEGVLR
jgi:branched-chain amino acid transport system ATP-binding protein